jgi:CHAT domain-containing protein
MNRLEASRPAGDQDDIDTLCANIASAAAGQGDLDAAIADLHSLPPSLPARGILAAALVEAMMWSNPMSDLRKMRELDTLLEISDGAVPSTPRWNRTRTAAQVASLVSAVAQRELSDIDNAKARLDDLAREAGADPALKPILDAAYLSLRFARSAHEGDAGALVGFSDDVQQFLHNPAVQHDPRVQSIRGVLNSAMEVLAAKDRDYDVTGRVRDMQLAAQDLPPGALRDAAEEAVRAMSMLGMGNNDGAERLTDEQLRELQTMAERPDLGGPDRALQHSVAAFAALGGWREVDLNRVETGIAHLREALAVAGPEDPQRILHTTGLALGLYRRSELTNSTADLRQARALLKEARLLAGGPRHPQWQMINGMLGDIRRLLGDGPDFHRPALDGLRSHVWQVLVQPDLSGATAAVRSAGTDAVEVARSSLVAGDPAGAISALDAGRGLALFAATEIRNVADRLQEAGNPELAQRWRTAAAAHDPERLPRELRRQVLSVLTAHSSAAALLDPPGFGEVQQALAVIDADALVYLVPGAGVIPGYAVIAPAAGPPSYLALPNLKVEGQPDIERYLATLARRDTAAVRSPDDLIDGSRDLAPPDDGTELAGSLEKLCTWAWGAAMGPLIDSYLSRLPHPSARPHRVVLVPMGDLARIPWQAARDKAGKYAIERIAISQAASTRMLCHSAALSPVAPSPVGLMVGDPDTGGVARELPAARMEAYAIRQASYRGARYLGRRPDGSTSPSGVGSSDEVRQWLTSSSPAAGAMLHLACHGVVNTATDRPTAYLLLAGGEGLKAEELIALMAQAPARDIGLVVLAACRTGLSINGYDEAYSLGTAFLAGGARSVVSTQWSVPDETTSALMFMFHHLMRGCGRTPWAALREAQLWMLNPSRVVPDEMPDQLREQLDHDKLSDVIAWAAFVHWGQ